MLELMIEMYNRLSESMILLGEPINLLFDPFGNGTRHKDANQNRQSQTKRV